MAYRDLAYYQYCFLNLRVNKVANKLSPHKPLLLLSVIDLVETGTITSTRVTLSKELIETFATNALLYASHLDHFHPNIGMPFFYMRSEPFWKLVPKEEGVIPIANTLQSLHRYYKYAEIDRELFDLLLNDDNRQQLRNILIGIYLNK